MSFFLYIYGIMRGLSKIILPILFLLPTAMASAQNNAYAIDDECYVLFQRAESMAGRVTDEQFNLVNDSLLHIALAKNDKKSQVLYYVERLKHAIRSKSDESRILKAFEELKSASTSNGYRQHFYYAYELTQNYYYNTGRANTAIELLQEMQAIALEQSDAYGLWYSSRYMVALYMDMNDYVSAKKYILQSIKVYNETDDPTVRRQSISRVY